MAFLFLGPTQPTVGACIPIYRGGASLVTGSLGLAPHSAVI